MEYEVRFEEGQNIDKLNSMFSNFGLMVTCSLAFKFFNVNSMVSCLSRTYSIKSRSIRSTTELQFSSGANVRVAPSRRTTNGLIYPVNPYRSASTLNTGKESITDVTGDSVIQRMYETLNSTILCGACCVVVRSPPPAELMFRFSNEDNFVMISQSAVIHDDSLKSDNNTKAAAEEETTGFYIDCSHSLDSYCVRDDDINTEELVFGRFKEQNNKSRLNKFIGGRVALRRALKLIDRGDSPSILKNEYGAPLLPDGTIGSISHKDDLAVGVAASDIIGRIGVDIERCQNKNAGLLSRKLLTEREQENLGKIPGISANEEVLLRFSFKESVFKAIHPFLRRPVGFNEVEIEPKSDGTADIIFLLKSGGSFKYEAMWRKQNDSYWVTCVYFTDPLP